MTAKAPRSARRLIADTVALYRRYPLLFLTLAAAVIVPYELFVLLATGAGPFEVEETSAGWALGLADMVLITPLVSALHVHAVADVRGGETPDLDSVARRGLQALPVVAAASVMSGLGIFVGFIALIVPGIVLTLRWFVVAQAAAIEREGWTAALGRSHELVRGNYRHVIAYGFLVFLVVLIPIAVGIGVVETGISKPASVALGIALDIVAWSFGALATALLYFDLRTRRELAPAAGQGTGGGEPDPVPREAAAADHDLDPRLYSDETRPAGWYVNPAAPHRMRYWTRGERPGWALKATRTPRKVRRSWDARAASEDPPEAS